MLNAAHTGSGICSCASARKGMPLETVSVLLGHSFIKITEKHYAR